jgi:hypothetical protein
MMREMRPLTGPQRVRSLPDGLLAMPASFRHSDLPNGLHLPGRPWKTSPVLKSIRTILFALCAAMFCPASAAFAGPLKIDEYQVDLGPPPPDGTAAEATLPKRVDTVVEWTACGREPFFSERVRNREKVEENTLHVVIGKIRWLQTQPGASCRKTVRQRKDQIAVWTRAAEPDAPDDDIVAKFMERFNARFKEVFKTSGPVDNCGNPVSVDLKQSLDEGGQPLPDLYDVTFDVSRACMAQQINVALDRDHAKKEGRMGTEKLPCGLGNTGAGEWDVSIRDLIRIVYLDRGSPNPILNPDTTNHIINDLISVSGPLEEESYSLFECGNQEDDTGSPQERADERSWTEDGLWDDIGDLLDWLWKRLLIIVAVAAVIFAAAAVGFAWIIPIIATVGVAAVAVGFLRIPESENHILMINTSRYLMNQLIIDTLTDDDDKEDFEDDNEDVKEWLLDKLQTIVKEDFREYNARPYQRYSITAILNLHDFARDDDLTTASQIVLDLASAKFAAGSNQGRRVAPFRRRMELIPEEMLGNRPFFDMTSLADHQVAAMLLFAGQTQQLPGNKASIPSLGEMIYEASSSYRPHSMILDVAANKSKPYEQRIHHDGYEIYSSTPSFLISAGGIQTGLANKPLIGPFSFTPPKGFEFDADRGAAMPTVLIPNAPRRQVVVTDFLRILGTAEYYDKVKGEITVDVANDVKEKVTSWTYDHNICIRQGFACGMNIVIPPAINNSQCLIAALGAPDQWRFIDSHSCPAYNGAPRFYVAIYRQPCVLSGNECLFIENWGFFEAVANPGMSIEQFMDQVISSNPPALTAPLQIPSSSIGTYVSSQGERITFDVRGHERDSDTYGIISVNNTSEGEADDWPLGSMGPILSEDGRATIRSLNPPFFPNSKIIIDFTDSDHPKREVM